jgi:propionate CoA-transferase
MTLWGVAGMGSRGKHQFLDRLSHAGILTKVIMGHWEAAKELTELALEEKIEAYNLPLGVLSHLVRAAAGRKPAIISEIGLKTSWTPVMTAADSIRFPRIKLVELMFMDGKDYLLYKTPKFDACIVRGTTADPKGNITMEKEATILDALTIAQATKANGGIVIVTG